MTVMDASGDLRVRADVNAGWTRNVMKGSLFQRDVTCAVRQRPIIAISLNPCTIITIPAPKTIPAPRMVAETIMTRLNALTATGAIGLDGKMALDAAMMSMTAMNASCDLRVREDVNAGWT